MSQLSKTELMNIEGGFNVTGVIINDFSNMFKTVADLGRNFGSALRRIGSNRMCSL